MTTPLPGLPDDPLLEDDAPQAVTREAAARELIRRVRARNSLVEYARAIDIPGAPLSETDEDCDVFTPVESDVALHHRIIMSEVQRCMETYGGRLIILAPPGSAKALALDTPIPTPDGWKKMGMLRVGDQIFDERGKVCSVTWVSPVHRQRPVYVVRTDCGDEIIADRDHEWRVQLCRKSQRRSIIDTATLALPRGKRSLVDRAGALDLPKVKLPIDPYLLGLWLGDGHSSGLRITAALEDQKHYREYLTGIGIETRDTTIPITFQVIGQRANFVSLGLIKDHLEDGRKHIPPQYLRASRAQRMALLQGLIDTDGTVCRKRGCTTFCSTRIELALGVRELVRSLGVKAGWSESIARVNGKDCGPVYRVSFYLKDSARLARKRRWTRDQYRTPNTYLEATPAGVADTVCIEVDSPSHLFLCGRSMTPTHNSTYASVVGPVWKMKKTPNYRIILGSYNMKIAAKQSRRARQLARQDKEISIWDDRPFLAGDQKAIDQWALSNGSEFMAAGLQSGITGSRAHGVVIDDPVKNREEADSETIREKIYDEYADAVTTRLMPGGWICLIQTRWSPDDLAGRILPEDYDGQSGDVLCRDGQVWRVINFPAKCERIDDPLGRPIGHYIWPEWFSQTKDPTDGTHWAKWETNPRTARTWAALFQQRPTLGEGLEIRREWFKWYDPDIEPGKPGGCPDLLTIYGATDIATKEDKSDFSEHGIIGLDTDMNFWFRDWWYGQKTTDVSIANAIALILRWHPWRWWDEGGPIDNAIRPHFTAAMRASQPPCYVELESKPSIKNKTLKLASFQARVAGGQVYMPLKRAWATRLVDQLCAFPAVQNDDACDVCGLLGRGIDSMISPHRPRAPERKELIPFTGAWVEHTEQAEMKPRYT